MVRQEIQQIVEKHASQDPELKSLWDDHMLYEKQIEKLESKAYRTPTEEQQLKMLKKQKLEGKTRLHDKIEKLLAAEKEK